MVKRLLTKKNILWSLFFIAMGMLFLTPIAIVFAVNSKSLQNYALGKYNQGIPGSLHFDLIKIRPLGGEVIASNFSLKAENSQKIIGFDSLRIKLKPLELLHKKVLLEQIWLSGIEEYLEIKDSVLNINRALGLDDSPKEQEKKDSSSQSSWNVVLEDVYIHNERLNFYNERDSTELDAYHFTIKANGNVNEKTAKVILNTKAIQTNTKGKKLAIDSLEIHLIALPEEKLHVSLDANILETPVNLEGNIQNYSSEVQWDLNLKYNLLMNRWAKGLNLGNWDGKGEIQLTSQGNLEKNKSQIHLAAKISELDSTGKVPKKIHQLSLENLTVDLKDEKPHTSSSDSVQNQKLWSSPKKLSLNVEGLSYAEELGRIFVPETRANIKLGLKEKQIKNLRLKMANRFLNAHAGADITGFTAEDSLRLNLDIETDLGKFDLAKKKSLDGVIHLQSDITGFLNNPQAKLAMSISKLKFGKVKGLNGNIEAELLDRNAVISQLQLKQGKGSLNFKGRLDAKQAFPSGFLDSLKDLNELSYGGKLDVKNWDMDPYLWDSSFQNGLVAGDFEIAGKGVMPSNLDLNVSGQWTLHNLDYQPGKTKLKAQGKLSLQINNNQISWQNFDLEMAKGKISSRGDFNLMDSSSQATFDIINMDLGELAIWSGQGGSFAGELNSQIRLAGNYLRPNIDLSLGVRDAEAIQKGPLSVQLMTSLDSTGYLKLSQLKANLKESRIELVGEAQLFNNNLLSLKETIPKVLQLNLDAKLHLEELDSSLGGIVSADLKASGSWPQMNGEGVINGSQLKLGPQSISELNIPLKILADSISIGAGKINLSGNNIINLSGGIVPGKSFAVDINSKEFHLAALNALDSADAAGAKVNLSLTGAGSLDDPQVEMEASIFGFQYKNVLIDALNVFAKYEDKKVNGEFKQLIEGPFYFDPLTSDFQSQLMLNNIELAPFLKLAGMDGWVGFLSGELGVAGNSKRILNANARAKFQNLNLSKDGKDIVRVTDQEFQLENGNILAENFAMELGENGYIHIDASGDLKNEINAELDLKAQLEDFVVLMPPDLELSGTLYSKASLKYKDNVPSYKANIQLENIIYTPPSLEQTLKIEMAKINGDANTLRLDSLLGYWDRGSIKIKGEMDHKNFKPINYNLNLAANRVPFILPNTLDLLFDLDANLKGDSASGLIKGQLTLLDGLYYQNLRLNNIVSSETERAPPPELPDTSKGGLINNIILDVGVNSKRPLVVDNNVAYLELIPDVKVQGKMLNPVVIGRAQGKEGVIKWRRRDFKITKAVIDFLNPYKTEASLNISSQIGIRDWLIELGINGTAPDNLVLSLSEKNANPPLEMADILTVLATNKTSSELLGKEGEKPVSKESLLLSYMANAISKPLKENTSLDVLEIEAGQTKTGEQSDKISLKLGKNITRRLTTFYTLETDKGQVIQKGSAEYKLLESYILEGFQDTEDVYGGAVQWGIRWR